MSIRSFTFWYIFLAIENLGADLIVFTQMYLHKYMCIQELGRRCGRTEKCCLKREPVYRTKWKMDSPKLDMNLVLLFHGISFSIHWNSSWAPSILFRYDRCYSQLHINYSYRGFKLADCPLAFWLMCLTQSGNAHTKNNAIKMSERARFVKKKERKCYATEYDRLFWLDHGYDLVRLQFSFRLML